MFLLIKYALEGFSAMEVAFFQAAIGAVGLLVVVLTEEGKAPRLAISCAGLYWRSCSGSPR